MYVFNVPQLQNVSPTALYFSQGNVATLAEAIDLMGWLQLHVKLANDQILRVLHFMNAPAPVLSTPNWTALQVSKVSDTPEMELIHFGLQLISQTWTLLGTAGENSNQVSSGNVLSCTNCHQENGVKPYIVGRRHRPLSPLHGSFR